MGCRSSRPDSKFASATTFNKLTVRIKDGAELSSSGNKFDLQDTGAEVEVSPRTFKKIAALIKDGSKRLENDSAPMDRESKARVSAREISELPTLAETKVGSEQLNNESSAKDDTRYPEDGRGYLLLINFEHSRPGSEEDVNRIKRFFSETLNFEIEHRKDIDEVKQYIKSKNNTKKRGLIRTSCCPYSKDEVKQNTDDKKAYYDNKDSTKAAVKMDTAMKDMDRNTLLEYLRTLKTHIESSYYCFVCVIMAHGYKDGIYTRISADKTELMKEAVLMTEIKELFDNTCMQQFAGKPKIFIVNACRGTQEMLASVPYTKKKVTDSWQEKPNKPQRALQYSDIAECFSTVPDYVSWRDDEQGTVFIQTCMDVFETDFHKSDMMEMMTTVNRKMQTKEDQVAHFDNTLTRKLYLVKCAGRCVGVTALYMAMVNQQSTMNNVYNQQPYSGYSGLPMASDKLHDTPSTSGQCLTDPQTPIQ